MKDLQNLELPFTANELSLIRKDVAANTNKKSVFRVTQLEDRSEVKVWSFFGFSIPLLF